MANPVKSTKYVMNSMFAFIIDQPVHQTIRQLRIVTIVMLIISVDIMYRLVGILEQAEHLTKGQTAAAVATLAAAVFACIWKSIANLAESQKADD